MERSSTIIISNANLKTGLHFAPQSFFPRWSVRGSHWDHEECVILHRANLPLHRAY